MYCMRRRTTQCKRTTRGTRADSGRHRTGVCAPGARQGGTCPCSRICSWARQAAPRRFTVLCGRSAGALSQHISQSPMLSKKGQQQVTGSKLSSCAVWCRWLVPLAYMHLCTLPLKVRTCAAAPFFSTLDACTQMRLGCMRTWGCMQQYRMTACGRSGRGHAMQTPTHLNQVAPAVLLCMSAREGNRQVYE